MYSSNLERKKSMNWIKEKKSYRLLFQAGIPLIPLIEVYRSFFGDSIQIAGFAIEEILILLWVGTLFVAGVFFSFAEKKKSLLLGTGIYLAIFFSYLLLHAYNVSQFHSTLLPGANPSFVREAYYTIRMYFAPLSMILSALLIGISQKELFSALKGALWVITLLIVVPDLFGVSFASYQDGNVLVEGSFFTWFSLPEGSDWAKYTAKGLFSSANDVGAILFGMTPIVAYSALKKGSLFDFILLFLTGVASIMVSTKIGSYGFFLALAAATAVFVFQFLLSPGKIKELRTPLLVLLIGLILVPLFLISPGKKLQSHRDAQEESADRPTESVDEIEDVTEDADGISPEDTLLLEEYLSCHYWDHFIDPWFLELYPVDADPEFWAQVVSRDNHLNSDSRSFKLEMIHRIRQRNDRPMDSLFGIGFTSGIPYAERDYFNQYYLYGWVGMAVLILPFVLLFFYGISRLLLAFLQKKELLSQACLCVSLFAFLVTAWFAGHVFDTLFTTYFFALASTGVVTLRNQYEE